MARDDEGDHAVRLQGSSHASAPWHSRREFFGSIAAVGMATALRRSSLLTQGAAESAPTRLIDVHHHVFPPDFIKATLNVFIGQNRTVVSAWTLQHSLAEMDRNGVGTAIVSMTSPGTWLGDVQASRSLTRKCNEYSAQLPA